MFFSGGNLHKTWAILKEAKQMVAPLQEKKQLLSFLSVAELSWSVGFQWGAQRVLGAVTGELGSLFFADRQKRHSRLWNESSIVPLFSRDN